jgi:hypothetical protein
MIKADTATDEILLVDKVSKDGGDYAVICPHCKRVIGIAGDDLSEIQGEQYHHRSNEFIACGGWLEISHDARYVKGLFDGM